jgi:predicted ribosome quality control (RQC) complex YloA/Tae2 family protein
MCREALDEGYAFFVSGSYQDYVSIKKLYEYYLDNRGELFADLEVGKEGFSEFQTGLSASFAATYEKYEDFRETECYQWLSENAQRYFDRYGKLKRTYEAVSRLIIESESDLEHLRSIQTSLDIAVAEEDLLQIRQELAQGGYIKKRSGSGKREKVTSRPFHYISSDGYDIYVGKNNFQNDELTFKFANGGDWWFHAKKIPGSHVVMRIKQGEEVPDRAFEEAARLAAFYSKGRDQDKVEIDYVKRKEVKKPAGAKPGFVVYYTNYSMVASPDISMLKEAD